MKLGALLAAILCAAISPAMAQWDPIGEVDRRPNFHIPPRVAMDTIRFGRRYWQSIQFSKPRRDGAAPLVVVIPDSVFRVLTGPYPTDWLHYRLNKTGYAVATVPYDPVKTGPAAALSDLASAIGLLRNQSSKRGIDPERIVLVGVGSGAHFATLLATDEHYLAKAGVPFASVVGVVTVNGDGFDIPRRIATAGNFRAKGYEKIFGYDANVQRRFSPVSHLEPPNAPAFLLMAIKEPAVADQAREMVDALSTAGVDAQLVDLPKFRDGVLSTYFLAEPRAAGGEMLDFLQTVTRKAQP